MSENSLSLVVPFVMLVIIITFMHAVAEAKGIWRLAWLTVTLFYKSLTFNNGNNTYNVNNANNANNVNNVNNCSLNELSGTTCCVCRKSAIFTLQSHNDNLIGNGVEKTKWKSKKLT